jgi:hypothetical protein
MIDIGVVYARGANSFLEGKEAAKGGYPLVIRLHILLVVQEAVVT